MHDYRRDVDRARPTVRVALRRRHSKGRIIRLRAAAVHFARGGCAALRLPAIQLPPPVRQPPRLGACR